MDRPGRLVIICGMPGSGTEALARHLETEMAAHRTSPDDEMIASGTDLRDETERARIKYRQWCLTQILLAAGETVIIEWGTRTRSERLLLRRRARSLGAAVELHHREAAPHEPQERIRSRNCLDGLDDTNTPERCTDTGPSAAVFEPPSAWELGLYDMSAGPSGRPAWRPARAAR